MWSIQVVCCTCACNLTRWEKILSEVDLCRPFWTVPKYCILNNVIGNILSLANKQFLKACHSDYRRSFKEIVPCRKKQEKRNFWTFAGFLNETGTWGNLTSREYGIFSVVIFPYHEYGIFCCIWIFGTVRNRRNKGIFHKLKRRVNYANQSPGQKSCISRTQDATPEPK